MSILPVLSFVSGAALELLILNKLIKGPYRKYPILFADVLVLFFTGIIDATLYFDLGLWVGSARKVFWIDDSIRQVFLFILVLSLVYHSIPSDRRRVVLQRLLIAGSILFVAASYASYNDSSVWMTAVIRNMSFGAAILNLGLWAALIQRKNRDPQILLLSGGLGLQMTGEAMGHSLRMISRTFLTFGNVVLVVAHLLCLLAWWQAFRNVRRSSAIVDKRDDSGASFDADRSRGYTGNFQDETVLDRVH